MAVSCQYETLWDRNGDKQAQFLLAAAMERFEIQTASISFFNEDKEIRKVEFGHCEQDLVRGTSLAAHVLYSTEVLVVLDAFKVSVYFTKR